MDSQLHFQKVIQDIVESLKPFKLEKKEILEIKKNFEGLRISFLEFLGEIKLE